MAKKHGKDTVVKIGASDISAFCNASEITKSADTHDTTTYGNSAHRYNGGLLDNKFTCSGLYDNTAVTGPRAVLNGIVGTTVAVTRQPEGTGTGRPQDAFNAILNQYVETNPVADMVSWSAEFTIDGDVTSTTQA